MTDAELLKEAIRAACPDPDFDCLSDEEECFIHHPIHEAGRSGGVIVSVYADIDGLVEVMLKTLVDANRLA